MVCLVAKKTCFSQIGHRAKQLVLQCINGVSSNPVEGRKKNCQLQDIITTLFGLMFRRIYMSISRFSLRDKITLRLLKLYLNSGCCQGKNKNVTAQRSNSNTIWFNFQTYIIFSINLLSQVTLRSSGTDILYGCHLLRCLYNIFYFL